MLMNIAAIQMHSGDDVAANLAQAGQLLRQAAGGGARLAVLPENFAFMGARERDKLAHAETKGGGPIQDFLAQTAAALKLWLIGGTAPLRVPGRDDKVYAASLVYSPHGTLAARYDKIHLFDVDVMRDGKAETYRESNSIEFGAPHAVSVATAAGEVGLSVCYDLRFPELYRALSAAGAQILAVPSAFTDRTGEAHWEVLLRARAVENQCFVVAPGQSGTHPGGRRTWGHSMIVDPWGQILAQQADGPGAVVAEIDLARLAQIRQSFPALAHRRMNS
jgi:predicted amidohydrolase